MKSILPDPDQKDAAFSSARKISGIAANVGFDWPTLEGILKKCVEEIGELEEAVNSKSGEEIFSEFGDILFALSNLGRHLGLDPEEALNESTRRFVQRFRLVEEEVNKSRREWKDFTLEELDEMWEAAKRKAVQSSKNGSNERRATSNEKEKSKDKSLKSPINKTKAVKTSGKKTKIKK
ncbi:MAG: MazG nucleotide pyrophosphohydrolase domain-containing protein [bacterium]|nr:MazG nucleotide pyrophosphohydrolase domain-containing protein [bacterium]